MQANYTKQMDAIDVTLGENTFHIFPFSAFKAANLTGELAAVIAPLLASVAPLLGGKSEESFADMDIEKAAPEIGAAFNTLSGDKLEALLRKLLVTSKNISAETPAHDEATWLTEDLSNEIFCGNVQDMFVLAFHVIRVNYSGFFGKFGNQFGRVAELMTKTTA